jgi:(E)-4-hydroxy-3-methylbut-2-enyl-diphosphate synthase
MGCPVNGIGESVEADIGLGAGKGKGILYRRGVQVKAVDEKDMVEEVMKLVEEEIANRAAGVVREPAHAAMMPLKLAGV